ncbi:MAG: hypothetical protein EOP49_10010, partial [Sphingobacteriales bacterium]
MKTHNHLMSQSAIPADWASFYSQLQSKGKVPDATHDAISASLAVFRGMALNLADVESKIRSAGLTPLRVVIYADVLAIPKSFNWFAESTGLTIYARRVEAGPDASILLDYQQSDTANLLLFTGDIQGTLSVSALKSLKDEPKIYHFSGAEASPGVLVSLVDGGVIVDRLKPLQGRDLQLSADKHAYLNNVFIFGSLLYDQDPALALSLLLWVKGWSALYSELEELFYRSTTLANLLNAQINARENGAAFVPYLSKTMYVELAQAYVQEATKYESDYMQLFVCRQLTAQNIATAKSMLEQADSEKAYVEALLQQAATNYHNAVSSCDKAQLNFSKQQIITDRIAAQFQQIGIPDYQREQIIKAIVGLVTAVVTFAGAIGSMVSGNAAGAPAAAESAIGGATAIAKAAETTAGVAKTAGGVSDSMAQLKKLLEALKKVYDLAKSVMDVASDISAAKGQVEVIQSLADYADGVDLSAADGWAVYKIQADNVMKDPVDLNIGFAAEYREAMDILVVYGQAVSASQLSVIRAGQEFAAITFRLHYAAQKKESLHRLVSTLKEGDAPVLAMMQQFYFRYIDTKSALFAALKAYQASYFYWALAPSAVNPGIVDPVQDLNAGLKQLTAITMDTSSALSRFDPPPQTFEHMTFEVNDPKILHDLQTTGKASWVLPLDDAAFADLDRTRLRKLRVWLEGAQPQGSHDQVSITVTTSGNYLDRFGGKDFQFSSKPLTRAFHYEVKNHGLNPQWAFEDGSLGFVKMDGALDDEYRYYYFEPTPFAEWSIVVDTTHNKVDLSKVSKITMYFEGSAIAA